MCCGLVRSPSGLSEQGDVHMKLKRLNSAIIAVLMHVSYDQWGSSPLGLSNLQP